MLISDYFDAIKTRISDIEREEADTIKQVAGICADSIANGGVIHIRDTGHMLNSELVHRAGGLAGLTPMSFGLNVQNGNAFRAKSSESKPEFHSEVTEIALKRSNLQEGDVLFVGSVSGKSESVVELAMQARQMKVTVVAITSVEYSSQLESQHPSGKRLYEVADITINNHAPYGDAMLEVDGLDVKACPASGICAAVIMWAVTAGTVENLIAKGITPTVFKSVNAPGGPEDVDARVKRYREKGF